MVNISSNNNENITQRIYPTFFEKSIDQSYFSDKINKNILKVFDDNCENDVIDHIVKRCNYILKYEKLSHIYGLKVYYDEKNNISYSKVCYGGERSIEYYTKDLKKIKKVSTPLGKMYYSDSDLKTYVSSTKYNEKNALLMTGCNNGILVDSLSNPIIKRIKSGERMTVVLCRTRTAAFKYRCHKMKFKDEEFDNLSTKDKYKEQDYYGASCISSYEHFEKIDILDKKTRKDDICALFMDSISVEEFIKMYEDIKILYPKVKFYIDLNITTRDGKHVSKKGKKLDVANINVARLIYARTNASFVLRDDVCKELSKTRPLSESYKYKNIISLICGLIYDFSSVKEEEPVSTETKAHQSTETKSEQSEEIIIEVKAEQYTEEKDNIVKLMLSKVNLPHNKPKEEAKPIEIINQDKSNECRYPFNGTHTKAEITAIRQKILNTALSINNFEGWINDMYDETIYNYLNLGLDIIDTSCIRYFIHELNQIDLDFPYYMKTAILCAKESINEGLSSILEEVKGHIHDSKNNEDDYVILSSLQSKMYCLFNLIVYDLETILFGENVPEVHRDPP